MGEILGTELDGRRLRILTLHGEGLQGLAIISTLDELCSRISHLKETKRSQSPSGLFDIICGTGIGAFLATLLGRYQLDIPKCKQVYMDLSDYIEERNASRRTVARDLRQDDVQEFLQALIQQEGWADSMNFENDQPETKCQNFMLASAHKHYGQRSTTEVFHGFQISADKSAAQKAFRGNNGEVAKKTAQAVAHPIPSAQLQGSKVTDSNESLVQSLPNIATTVIRHTAAKYEASDIDLIINVGPSSDADQGGTTVARLPTSPGKWVMQKTSPIRSAAMVAIKTTLKTFSSHEESAQDQQPTQPTRRAKSISVMQWPIQGLGFGISNDQPDPAQVIHGQDVAEDQAKLKSASDIDGRFFNFDTAIKGAGGNDSDMTELKETRVEIRNILQFMDASGLFSEAVAQYKSR